MNKNKKIIMISVAVVVIVALVIVMGVELGKAHRTGENVTTTKNETENTITKKAEEVTTSEAADITLEEIETTGKKNKKNKKDDNYWKKVQVIEDGNENETRTEKNGEVATKKDGSVDDGWSPVVSPDDLEKK